MAQQKTVDPKLVPQARRVVPASAYAVQATRRQPGAATGATPTAPKPVAKLSDFESEMFAAWARD